MPEYRPDAPSVDLFTADEELVLATWFDIDHPQYGSRVDDIFDRWNIPSEILDYRRIDAAVAQILLERIQDDLPNWTALAGDRFVIARGNLDRRARRKIELWPHHLLTINWADSGSGFSWPPVSSWPMAKAEQRSPSAPAPLQGLRRYYGLLRPCAPLRYSRPHGWSRLRLVPSRRRRDEAQVLTFHTKAWSSFAPPTCRMPLGPASGFSRADPGGRVTPRF